MSHVQATADDAQQPEETSGAPKVTKFLTLSNFSLPSLNELPRPTPRQACVVVGALWSLSNLATSCSCEGGMPFWSGTIAGATVGYYAHEIGAAVLSTERGQQWLSTAKEKGSDIKQRTLAYFAGKSDKPKTS